MGNSHTEGHAITPLVLWVAGIACALLSFIGITGLVKLDKMQNSQAEANSQLAILVTSQTYDRREIDAIKGDVKATQAEVRGIAERLGKVESRR